MKIEAKDIRMVPLDELALNPKNLNKHPPAQIDRLVDLIKYQGFRVPVIVSNRSGFVLVGHGRIEAAKKLGLKEVPAIFQDFEDEAQEFAFGVSDNAIAAWAELDFSGINLELPAHGPDFNVDMLGIKNFEIEVADKEGQCNEDDVPEKVEPRTKLGDLYVMGGHRLLCGDATNIRHVERLMNGQLADMVFTDPPYNTGMSEKKNAGSTRLSHMFNDSFTEEEWQHLLAGMSQNYWAIMKDSSVAYVCLDWRRSHELVPHFKNLFKFSNLIVWDKVVHGLGSDYQYTHEFIHVFKKGSPKIDSHQGDQEYQDVWHVQRKIGRDDEHATKKPVELIERALKHASLNGHIVADFFCGSGSTLITCEKLNRRCFSMELSPQYCDVIVARWEAFTGKKAVLEESTCVQY